MEKYTCHKTVEAGLIASFTKTGVKLNNGELHLLSDEEYNRIDKAINGRDGYLVKYGDAYTSWSPKDVFEAGYKPVTKLHTFGDVVEALRDGLNARRDKWDVGRYIHLYDVPEDDGLQPCIVMCYSSSGGRIKRASTPMLDQDIFADDWVIL